MAEVMHVKCYECSLFSSSMVYHYRFYDMHTTDETMRPLPIN